MMQGFCGLPHARGGVSCALSGGTQICPSSPRTWGCFLKSFMLLSFLSVFPTHVGVFLSGRWIKIKNYCLPHARGGVSEGFKAYTVMIGSSPRTWGCFYETPQNPRIRKVFPTHVGVFLKVKSWQKLLNRLPHARGGVSPEGYEEVPYVLSSPRTWGCFHTCLPLRYACLVFPTHVGVFLYKALHICHPHRLPHARGGVSTVRTSVSEGYVVFPTHVGVFLCIRGTGAVRARLPHARGGVSSQFLLFTYTQKSSPRTWGCFPPQGRVA